MKRIALFLITNIAILAVAMLIMNIFNVGNYMQGSNLNLDQLFIFALIFGFVGSFISLATSKWMSKWLTKAEVIKTPSSQTEEWLLKTVRELSEKAGLPMPEVAIFPAMEANAFATGMTKKSALVAVSSGLLNRMNKNEIKAVLGHEIAHIANGDMVTMALLQGVLNTFVIFFAKIIAFVVDKIVLKNDSDERSWAFIVVDIIAQILIGILASLIVAKFSRYREFHADKGGAYLAGKENMIEALERLKMSEPAELPEQLAAFGISEKNKVLNLFNSHPPLDERIRVLKETPQTELKVA